MASATGLAYAIIVALICLLLATVLQLVQAAHVIRRSRSGAATAPKAALIFLALAIVSLLISYVFDISVTSLRLSQGSQTPPPSGAHLALVVVTTFLGQGLAPAAIFGSAEIIINSRIRVMGLQDKSLVPTKWGRIFHFLDLRLIPTLPIIVAVYLGLFSKAVLDTPTSAANYHAWIKASDYLYRAVVVIHAFLFRALATRAIQFHLLSKSESVRDPIMRTTILYHLTPVLFIRTVALFVFTPLSSSYATAKFPASATALLFAFDLFVGISTGLAVQALIGGAMRSGSEWSPPKTVGEQEVANGDVPGDVAAPAPSGHGKKRSRADSIALSPTRSTFGGGFNREGEVEEEPRN